MSYLPNNWDAELKAFSKKVLTICICAAALVLCLRRIVPAAVFEDKKGSISLEFPYDLSGYRFNLYQVGSASDEGFQMLPEFSEIKFETLKTASDRKNAAETCVKLVKKNKSKGTAAVVETKGGKTLGFPEVSPGIYLIVQEKRSSDLYECENFLAVFPSFNEDGTWNYEVHANVKAEKIPKPTITTKKPKTGDNQVILPWVICMGAAVLAGGILYKRKRKITPADDHKNQGHS